jgi:hypothetical protein
MLKMLVTAGFAIALTSSVLFAQSTTPPPDQNEAPLDQGAAPPTGGTLRGKELIAGCRSDAKSKGLRGPELKAAVHDCVAAVQPKVAARMQCRQQGKKQGLTDDPLKAFVRSCMAHEQ